MSPSTLGPLLQSFFVDYLVVQKGLRRSSVQSYRDTVRLFLVFVASDKRSKVSMVGLDDLTFDRVLLFLKDIEQTRGNAVSTRNQRLAALHTLFEYVARRAPEMLTTCQQVAAIPTKRSSPPETRYLERDEISRLFSGLPIVGRHAVRDRALLLFLYNTGARVQEASDLRVDSLDLTGSARARLCGKGGKWRTCPLWNQTAALLRRLVDTLPGDAPVFRSSSGRRLTRFGIFKLVRRHAWRLDTIGTRRKVSPHVFRHTTAVHLLEGGVEPNVIRGWLGHVDIATTNRYADINMRTKQAALQACEPPLAEHPRRPAWRDDERLLAWLASI